MIVQKKLLVALLGVSLMGASVYANTEEPLRGLLNNEYKIVMVNGKPTVVVRTKKDKVCAVTKAATVSTLISLGARTASEYLAPKEWRAPMMLALAGLGNGAVHFDLVKKIARNRMQIVKDGEAVATVGAIVGGMVVGGVYGPQSLSWIHNKLQRPQTGKPA